MECIFCLNENAYFDGVNYVCPDCGREWPCDEIADDDDDNDKLRCPECGSHLVYPDSSGINDYACDACGCRWDGDDDDYDEDMTMMKKKINCCNYGAGQIALLLPHYYMLQSEKD